MSKKKDKCKIIDNREAAHYNFKVKFTLRGKIKEEIKNELKGLYPEKPKDNEIFFSNKNKDNYVNVYVIRKPDRNWYISRELYLNRLNKKEEDDKVIKNKYTRADKVRVYKKSDDIKKIVILVIILIAGIITGFVVTSKKKKAELERIRMEQRLESERKKLNEKEKALLKRIKVLEEEYSSLIEERNPDLWVALVNVTAATSNRATIGTLNIENNEFYLEVDNADMTDILEGLRRNSYFSNVEFVRSNRKSSGDNAVFRGRIANNAVTADDNLLLEEKEEMLLDKIEEIKVSKEEKKKFTFSDYIRKLREDINAFRLKEEYIDNSDGNLRLMLKGSGDSIVQFLKNAKFRGDFASLHISSDSLFMSLSLLIKTDFKSDEKRESVEIKEDKTPVFAIAQVNESANNNKAAEILGSYIFIGNVTKNGLNYCVFKDTSSGSLFRFELREKAKENGTCERLGNGSYKIFKDNKEWIVR